MTEGRGLNFFGDIWIKTKVARLKIIVYPQKSIKEAAQQEIYQLITTKANDLLIDLFGVDWADNKGNMPKVPHAV